MLPNTIFCFLFLVVYWGMQAKPQGTNQSTQDIEKERWHPAFVHAHTKHTQDREAHTLLVYIALCSTCRTSFNLLISPKWNYVPIFSEGWKKSKSHRVSHWDRETSSVKESKVAFQANLKDHMFRNILLHCFLNFSFAWKRKHTGTTVVVHFHKYHTPMTLLPAHTRCTLPSARKL